MPKETKEKQSEFFAKDKASLEAWLTQHASESGSTWLVYYKPSLKRSDLTYSLIVDTLLCFGWVDSLPRKVDVERTSLRISPRNPKSAWSKINKEKVRRLKKEGRMRPQGEAAVTLARRSGTWDALNDVENLLLPDDLKKALKAEGKSSAWEEKPRSWKRGRLEMLLNAKGQATREKRIAAFLAELAR
ncbi:MAG: YdeI/OmpD-associated family protein [Patescibacteria group bacterium]